MLSVKIRTNIFVFKIRFTNYFIDKFLMANIIDKQKSSLSFEKCTICQDKTKVNHFGVAICNPCKVRDSIKAI